jgi:hypothetical protein
MMATGDAGGVVGELLMLLEIVADGDGTGRSSGLEK